MNEKIIKTGLREYSKQSQEYMYLFSFGKEMGFGTMNKENNYPKHLKKF